MKTYTFIQKNTFGDNTELNPILAISNNIETLNLFETYDRFGQQVGHYNAGDYHFDNSASDAIKDCNKALVSAGLLKNADEIQYDDDAKVDDLYGDNEDCNKELVQKFVDIWRDENQGITTVKGFDYWDGNNWKTVITSCDFNEPTHFIVEENAKQMNEEIEASEFIEETHGKRYYESENFWIVESAWAGDFESYQLFSKSECDLEYIK